MNPNPFPPSARGRGGINPFANNDRNKPRANWRNHPDFEEEEHREEGLPRPYKMEHEIDHAQPEQGRNLHSLNSLNDMGALQRIIREMMEPKARSGERPTYRKPYRLTLIKYLYHQVSRCQTSPCSTEKIPMPHQSNI
ncbi:unnamed protein product [Prunus armeniaca]